MKTGTSKIPLRPIKNKIIQTNSLNQQLTKKEANKSKKESNEPVENYWRRAGHSEMPGGLKYCSVLRSCQLAECPLTSQIHHETTITII